MKKELIDLVRVNLLLLCAIGVPQIEVKAQCDFAIAAELTHVSCFGANDGSIELIEDGSGSGLTYTWATMPVSNGQSTLSGLGPGDYTSIVTDNDGCTETFNYTITEPEELEVFTHPRLVCESSNATLLDSIRGGTEPYSLSWTDNNGVNCINCNNTVAPTQSGTYTVLVTDQNQCSVVQNVEIGVSSPITANVQVIPDSCGGTGGLIINANGGQGELIYFVNGQNITGTSVSGLFGGDIIEILIYDTTGCFYTESIVMPAQVLDLMEEITVEHVSCPGDEDGVIEVIADPNTVSGFALDNAIDFTTNNLFESLDGGSHTVYIEDINGCISEYEVTIAEAVAPVLTSVTEDCSCFGANDGELNISAFGGTTGNLTYSIDGIAPPEVDGIFNGLGPGSYTVTGIDANGCEFDQQFSISQPLEIIDTAIVIDCNCWNSEDGSIEMEALGGAGAFEFSRNGVDFQTSTFFNDLLPGTYNILIRDTTGCMKSRQVEVSAPDTLEIETQTTNNTCPSEQAGEIVIIVSGGTPFYEYRLNNGPFVSSNTFSNLEAGFYQVTVKDENTCQRAQTVEIFEPETPETEIEQTPASCPTQPNGGIVIIVSGGTPYHSYSLDGLSYQSDNSFENLLPGIYTVYLKDDNNCVFVEDVILESGPGIQLDIEVSSWLEGANIDLTVFGGTPPFQFDWSNGETTEDILVSENGTYVVTIDDNGGCSLNDTVTVTRVSVDEYRDQGITVYPNPVADILRLEGRKNLESPTIVRLYDSTSRLIKATSWNSDTIHDLDMSGYSSGMYQVTIGESESQVVIPILKVDR